jgi:hypothetical protein
MENRMERTSGFCIESVDHLFLFCANIFLNWLNFNRLNLSIIVNLQQIEDLLYSSLDLNTEIGYTTEHCLLQFFGILGF